MTQTFQRAALVETLLNTLEAERYMRRPLLNTIVDELSARSGLEGAVDAARAILDGLESGQLQEREFVVRIGALRELVSARVALTAVSASAA